MNVFEKKQWKRIGLSLVAIIVAVLFLTGIIGGKQMTYQVEEPLTPMLEGITVSMGANAENSEAEDYLEQDPYLVNIYEGYGFAKDYKAARGHAYTLEDVAKTERPHDQAKCITCKTPDFTKLVNEEGVGVYTRPFDEVMSQMTQAISCYSCHGDDKGNNGQIVITHSYVDEALGENAASIDPKTLNCGQCHIEYYFTPEDSETMMPYSSKEEMTPEAILAYYDEMGFKDWEQPGTGTPMLKAQHPEMETFLYSAHANMGLNCSSCHMAEETAEDGTTYHSHTLVSPLQSETLMATCAACHGSAEAAKTLVTATQEKVTSRETEVGNRLSSLKDTLTSAVAEGTLTEEELDAVRKLHREAQWFFDFCYVENSEGAHNSKLSLRCLDTADEKIAEAMTLLTGETPEPAEEPAAADGELTATEQGFGGEVTVHLELNDDKTVKSLAIDTPNETPGLGQRASEAEFTDQFIGKAGPFTYGENGIDALSGATVTSNAVLKAINGLLADTEEPAAEEPAAADGELMATEQGFGGEVTVHLGLNEDQTVKSLAIDTPNETPGLGQRASEAEFTDQFIGKAGPFTYGENGIDALSGATVTSNAVLKAINGLFTAAAPSDEEPAAEETPAEETPAEEKPAETPEKTEESDASSGLVFGSYLSEKETDFSKIRVTVSTRNDQITDCTITSEAKSEGSDFLTDAIKTEWAKAIVENQTADTDAITGATLTYSSKAVQEAVAEIRQQMAGEAAAAEEKPAAEEAPAEEKPAETPAKTEESSASSGLVFGSYLSEKETDFSRIRVMVSTKNDQITDCTITSEAKSEGSDFLTDAIKTEWAKAIVENQTADTDAITGATLTYSSKAVQEAVAEIRQQMGGEAAAAEEQPAAEEAPAEEQPAEEQPAAEEPPAEEQPAEEPAADGELTATEQGFGGEVTVHLGLNEDQTVKSLAIDTPNETPGLGQRASEAEFTDQFVGKTGPFTYGENGIDALSGATVTSNAVLKAINGLFPGAEPSAEEPAAEEAPAEEKPAETPAQKEESDASSGLVFGSYLSEKETDFSKIRVTVSTRNDQITDCTITSEAKSEGSDFLTDAIKTEWAKAIVENQTADTDAITGATLTYSSKAVQEAVAEIRQQMTGEAAAEQPAAEEEPAAEEPAAEEPAAEEQPAEEPTAEEEPAEAPEKKETGSAPSGQAFGIYRSEKETDFSTIRVTIKVKNGEITECTITSEEKSAGSDLLTDAIREEWAKAIVDTQSAEPDAITGATLKISAGAVQEAAAEILEKIR